MNLALFFDGTWNDRGTGTNVRRLYELASGPDGRAAPPGSWRGAPQVRWYDAGVGTRWHDRLRGGAFGRGLWNNIREGYRFLCEHHREGDRIFLCGFSRGAYTARSLAGLVRKCGLLVRYGPESALRAFTLYHERTVDPDGPESAAFRAGHSRPARIRGLGVWDTVGSLGIPLSKVPLGRDDFRWHDTRLSGIVDRAFHALALDEARDDYAPAVWTGDIPPGCEEVEQRWFSGAHANVGGGYPGNRLSDLPLAWLAGKMAAAGLELSGRPVLAGDEHREPVVDSYAGFLGGLYGRVKERVPRVVGRGLCETVDGSVRRRMAEDASYSPPLARLEGPA